MRMTNSWCAVFLALSASLWATSAASQEDPHKDLELRACGPKGKEVNYVESTDKHQHSTAELPAAKALVYVLRPTMIGMAIQTKLAVDGDWKGVNKGKSYFYFTLDPGEHAFCSAAENHAVLVATVEAGKTYYIQQHIEMGVMKARNEISFMPEDEGVKKLEKLHLATWRER
jgi:Protein of unknown function (DUF2846)